MKHYIVFLIFLGFSLFGVSANQYDLSESTNELSVVVDRYGRSYIDLGVKEAPFTYNLGTNDPDSVEILGIGSGGIGCCFTTTSSSFILLTFKGWGNATKVRLLNDQMSQVMMVSRLIGGRCIFSTKINPGTYYVQSDAIDNNGPFVTEVKTCAIIPESINDIGSHGFSFNWSGGYSNNKTSSVYGRADLEESFYNFTITDSSNITIRMVTEKMLYPSLSLLNSSGSLIWHQKISSNSSSNNSIEHTCLLSKGTYYVVTEGEGGYSALSVKGNIALPNGIDLGNYESEFTISKTHINADFPNRYGTPMGDIFYSFTLLKPMKVEIDHCGSPNAMRTCVYLLTKEGELIASNIGSGQTGKCNNKYLASIEQEVLAAGTYYIISEGNNIQGSITTNVTGTPLEVPVIDIGSKYTQFTYSNAQNTMTSQSYFGNLMNDVRYKFTLERSMSVEISHCWSSLGLTNFYLLDSSGKEMYTPKYTGPCSNSGNQFYTKLDLSRGTYYVVSEGYNKNGEITTNISGIPYAIDTIDLGTKATYFYYNHSPESNNRLVENYYTFTLKHTMKVSVFQISTYLKESHLHLLDVNGELIEASANTNMQNARIEKTLYPGTYYILSQTETNGEISVNINGTFIEPECIDLGVRSTSFSESHKVDTRNYTNNFEGFTSNDAFYKISIASPLKMRISVEGTDIDAYFTIIQEGGNKQITSGAVSVWDGEFDAAEVYFIVVEGGEGENGIIKLRLSAQKNKKSLTVQPANPSSDHNYILTKIPTVKVSNKDEITSENSMQTIQYYDGLGRLTTSVQVGASPYHQDLVNRIQYDELGREYQKWLPVPMQHNDGRYVAEKVFDNKAVIFYEDEIPYVENIFENSPLNRVLGNKKAGNGWRNNPKKIEYKANEFDVKHFVLSDDSLILKKGYYEPNTLYKNIITDEDGNKSIEFRDRREILILTRQISQGNNHDTYYVYDDYNRLIYIIPPILSDKITENGIYGNTSDQKMNVNNYAYQYEYDSYDRNIKKRLPGCELIYMVYDKADKLIMSQDGNQRDRGVWIIYEYDKLGRLLFSGEYYRNTPTFEKAQSLHVNNVRTSSFDPTNSLGRNIGDCGYYLSWSSNPVRLLTVNYYDDYRFVELEGHALLDFREGLSTEYGTMHNSAKGLLTGTRIYTLDDSNEYIATAYYYDYRGRIIQQHSTNLVNGVDNIYNKYDFLGNIIEMQHTHYHSSRTLPSFDLGMTYSMIDEVYEHQYDHANRLIKTTYKTGNETITLVSCEYDELGRLNAKRQHNNINLVNYNYNIQNWITEINDGYFEQKIYYNDPFPLSVGTSDVYYNGNISAMTWTNGDSKGDYLFSYDELNRLKSGMSQQLYPSGKMPWYAEIFEYDKHSNITSLKRSKAHNAIDNLQFVYNGNQVTSIIDYVTETQNTYGVKEYANRNLTTTDFTYDKNGNMITDLDRDVVHIRYNLLNLPNVVQFRNGNQIKNRYLANGTKIESDYVTVHNTVNIPIGKTLTDVVTNGIDATEDKTLYVGNKEYKKLINALAYDGSDLALIRMHNTEGYMEKYINTKQYYYYRKDHLGNNREVWKVENDNQQTIQRTQYYPSGLPWADGIGASEQPYKFGGKEFIEMHGYDSYDFHARQMYPAIMRFTTMDPLAEKYYNISPYAYCGNNSINRIDPDGREWLTDKDKKFANKMTSSLNTQIYVHTQNLNKLDKNIEKRKNKGRDYTDLTLGKMELTQKIANLESSKGEINDMGETTEQVFTFNATSEDLAYTGRRLDGVIEIGYSATDMTNAIHEATHAYDFWKKGEFKDNTDYLQREVKAYQRQYSYDSRMPNSYWGQVRKLSNITDNWVLGVYTEKISKGFDGRISTVYYYPYGHHVYGKLYSPGKVRDYLDSKR